MPGSAELFAQFCSQDARFFVIAPAELQAAIETVERFLLLLNVSVTESEVVIGDVMLAIITQRIQKMFDRCLVILR